MIDPTAPATGIDPRPLRLLLEELRIEANRPGPKLIHKGVAADRVERALNEATPGDPPPIDPDRPCPHLNFAAAVNVGRITRSDDDPTIVGYTADITVQCVDCGEPFRWVGVPAGLSPRRPMVSVDETELHAPIRPASSDPDFGLGIPGFAIRMNGGDPR